MNLQTLKNSCPRQSRKRVGRGNGNNWGRCCGRGDKGQKSRSGYSRRPYFEGGQIPLFRRLPKKGFKSRAHKSYALVNLYDLEAMFESGAVIDAETLQGKGKIGDLGAGLKVLGEGEITKNLTVKATCFSASAKEKIEAAGGTCECV